MPKHKSCFCFLCCCCGANTDDETNNHELEERMHHADPEQVDEQYVPNSESSDEPEPNIQINIAALIQEFEKEESNLLNYEENAPNKISIDQKNYQRRFMLGYIHLEQDLEKQNTSSSSVKPKLISDKEKQISTVGWKLHISIDHSIENLSKAWKIMQWLAIKYQLTQIKMVSLKKLDNVKAGEEICIYLFKNEALLTNATELKTFLITIESLLRHFEILPSGKPKADQQISGSNYIYYRNDKHPTTLAYISQEQALGYAEANNVPAYNLLKENDPFETLKLKLTVQEDEKDEESVEEENQFPLPPRREY